MRFIQGDLIVKAQHAMRSLSFLSELVNVTGSVIIESNDRLALVELPKLVHVGSRIMIADNKVLARVTMPQVSNAACTIFQNPRLPERTSGSAGDGSGNISEACSVFSAIFRNQEEVRQTHPRALTYALTYALSHTK